MSGQGLPQICAGKGPSAYLLYPAGGKNNCRVPVRGQAQGKIFGFAIRANQAVGVGARQVERFALLRKLHPDLISFSH